MQSGTGNLVIWMQTTHLKTHQSLVSASTYLVEEVEIAFPWSLMHNANLLQQIVRGVSPTKLIIGSEKDFDVFSKSRWVVVSDSFRISCNNIKTRVVIKHPRRKETHGILRCCNVAKPIKCKTFPGYFSSRLSQKVATPLSLVWLTRQPFILPRIGFTVGFLCNSVAWRQNLLWAHAKNVDFDTSQPYHHISQGHGALNKYFCDIAWHHWGYPKPVIFWPRIHVLSSNCTTVSGEYQHHMTWE